MAISRPVRASATDLPDVMRPRRPVRANGRRRYELLLDAAERLLQRGGGEPLTIQRLAIEAGVPMASVYHFLPHPAAVSVALSERYLDGLESSIVAPIPGRARLDWPQIVAILNRRGFDFYCAHPYAQTLILGSDHSWAIRRADLSNNRRMADAIAGFIADHFPEAAPEVLLEAVVTAITVGDAVFSLSIAEGGAITEQAAQDSWLACCGFMAARFGRPPPMPELYSTIIDQH
jgi:AcrR family transcriptional regulator